MQISADYFYILVVTILYKNSNLVVVISFTKTMATMIVFALLFVMVTGSDVIATTPDVGENGDVMSILRTMQVKIFIGTVFRSFSQCSPYSFKTYITSVDWSFQGGHTPIKWKFFMFSLWFPRVFNFFPVVFMASKYNIYSTTLSTDITTNIILWTTIINEKESVAKMLFHNVISQLNICFKRSEDWFFKIFPVLGVKFPV